MTEMITVEIEVPANEVQIGDEVCISPGCWRKIIKITSGTHSGQYLLWFLSQAEQFPSESREALVKAYENGRLVLLRRTEENPTPL